MASAVSERDPRNRISLISFLFLLILLLNAIIFADLFLSVLHSPVTLLSIRVVIMATVLSFLVANSARHPEIRGQGWYFILAGFSLLLLEPLIGLALVYFPAAKRLLPGLDLAVIGLFQEIFCRLFGFFSLAYGFFLWIPSIIEARRKAERTAEILEEKVAERTMSLQETNRQLVQSKARLEEAARLKNEFLASFSHELKTPLNSILGFCRLLAEGRQGSLTEKQRNCIRIINSNSKTLLERISRILDFAQLEFEKVVPERRPLDLGELVAEVCSAFEPQLREKAVELVVEPAGTPARISTDRKIVSQIMQAVVDNAVKFTDRGAITIGFGADQPGGAWWLSVQDTGEGIPAGEIPYIFDAFRQGDGSLSRRHGGTGLGLSVARKLTRLLGGRIHIDSEPGRGSRFTFTFPLDPAAGSVELPAPLPESLEKQPNPTLRRE